MTTVPTTAADTGQVEAWITAHGTSARILADENPWALVMAGVLAYEVAKARAASLPETPGRKRARRGALVLTAMRRLTLDGGHLAVPMPLLKAAVEDVAGAAIDARPLAIVVAGLLDAGLLAGFGEVVALPAAAAIETDTARRMGAHLRTPWALTPAIERVVDKRLSGTTLSPEQCAVVRTAFAAPFVCCTGPAGSGKTVVIRELVRLLEAMGDTVLVAAPTGKACEVLVSRGIAQAVTVHRLLGLTPDDTRALAMPTVPAQPLRGAYLIVDEPTQIDAVTWQRLWAAIPPGMRVTMVGDVYQLGPVGPGNPFEVAVHMPDVVPVHTLRDVRRTTGRLTTNGLGLTRGATPIFDGPVDAPLSPFYDVRELPAHLRARASSTLAKNATAQDRELAAVAAYIVDLATVTIPAQIPGLRPGTDLQVLTPQAPGPLGTHALSAAIREIVNPKGEASRWTYAERTQKVRAGDAIIALDTLADTIPTGATGEILTLDQVARGAWAKFTHRQEPAFLTTDGLRRCALRYALTVHRTQGSEYPAVLQVVHDATARSLATRRSTYTAYTRGRRFSGIVGTDARLAYALANDHSDHRHSALERRLRAALREALRASPTP
jgi:exodeoxyribonuclease V alpha subunit